MATKPVIKLKRNHRRRAPTTKKRVRSDDLLHSIATNLSGLYGEHYFHSLTRYLTNTLGMEYAFVGELTRDRKDTVNIISAYLDGKNIDNFSYNLVDTPCQNIISRGLCAYPRRVQKLFPKDHNLVDIGAECYVGVPLFGSSGQPLGLLSVMGRQPLCDRKAVESVLQIMAARTATEIERQHLHQDLGESYRTLTTLMTNLPGMVYRCRNDKDWTLEFVSEGCLALTGYTAEDFVSRRTITYGQLIHPEDRESVWNGVQAALREKRPFQLLYRITTADDKVKWVWEQGRGIFTSDGELLALEGFITDNSECVNAEHAVRESNTLLENVFSNPHVMIAYLDPQFNFIRVNQAYAKDEGHAPDFFIGKNHFDLYPDAKNQAIFQRVADTGEPFVAHARPFEYTEQTEHPERGVTYWDWNLTPIKEDGDVTGLVLLLVNVTERLRVEAEMRKLSGAVEQTADLIVVTDDQGRIEYVNPAFEATTGYSRAEIMGNTPRVVKSDRHDKLFYRELWATIFAGRVYRNVLINRRKDGSLYYEEKTITPIKDGEGRITHFVSTGKDITERMQAQKRLQYLAHHDALTDLPNRAMFFERLNHALTRVRWTKRPLAVLFLDLDRFKNINDTLGHNIGDNALRVAAERLLSCVREGDTVARLGGDEFTVLLEDIADPGDVPAIAQKILDTLSSPFVVNDRELVMTTSIGISLYPNDGEDSLKLLRNADTAMYRAKDQGRNKYQFYSSEMSVKALEKFMLEASLRHALERAEFLLYYQPQVDLATRRITGVEALLRWQHPDLGLISPAQFIPVAEETGLMKSIDEWVLHTACAQARAWQSAGMAPITMIVNLSGRSFSEPTLAGSISRALGTSCLAPEQLELEITESVIMHNAQATVELLGNLKRMGLKLAVDDFGTGYSSLNYLKRFPIDTLKIDQSFVRDITNDEDDAAIVSAVIAMGHSLQLKVIAEGVETSGQLAFLRQHGCDSMQGYLFSRPLPAEEITRLLQSGKKL